MALTSDALWVANALDLTVSRIELASGHVTQTVPVGDGPNTVVAGSGAVWVSNEFGGTVTRIDPATGKATRRISVGGSPRGMALIGSSPWVAIGGFVSAAHRGGTLTVEVPIVPGGRGIDFQYYYELPALAMLYDGLVAQRRTGGAAGLTLVPDLATDLPRPSDGGRVYTFTLRRGIHYSTGTEVRPEDIKRGLLRALRGPAPAYLTGIDGAKECVAHPARCDLSRGVVIDDANSRIVLRLTAPDPEFLYKLSLFVYASAPGVSLGESQTPIPTTGPYMITGYRKGVKELTLTRNPYFKQWSFAARPDGYPDVIHFKKVDAAEQRLADALAGRADLVEASDLPLEAADSVAHQHPERLHSDFALGHFYAWLNTRAAPFNDVRVRRAVNLAVDRRKLVALTGGSRATAATCQAFPPNFPGYRPYCPYTLNPQPTGSYDGPDLVAASKLIAASGTAGASIVVSSNNDDPISLAVSAYYVDLLRRLDYRATRVIPPASYDGDSRFGAQMGLGYWGVDFPAPSNFWSPVLSCATYRPPGQLTLNWSSYCNHDVDDLAERALALEASDPAAARRLWTEVDHQITDDAPWVFGVSTRQAAVVSTRTGNYQSNPVVGPLIDQMWVQ